MLSLSIKLLLFTVATLVTTAHANPNAQSMFERELRTYFASFAGGRDIVDAIYYSEPWSGEYPCPDRNDFQPQGQYLKSEFSYVLVFERILCRVGLGYATGDLVRPDQIARVYAECVPMTPEQRNSGSVADLPLQFAAARQALLENTTTVWANVNASKLAAKAKSFSFSGLPPRLEASRLYTLGRGAISAERGTRVRALYMANIYGKQADETPLNYTATGDLWVADFVQLGAQYRQEKTGDSVDRTCEKTFLGRLLDWAPTPMF